MGIHVGTPGSGRPAKRGSPRSAQRGGRAGSRGESRPLDDPENLARGDQAIAGARAFGIARRVEEDDVAFAVDILADRKQRYARPDRGVDAGWRIPSRLYGCQGPPANQSPIVSTSMRGGCSTSSR